MGPPVLAEVAFRGGRKPAGHRLVPGFRRPCDHLLYLASPGEGTLEFLFLCHQSLEKSRGWGEDDGEWMGGRSGSTARGRWPFFRQSHLLSPAGSLLQLRSLRQRAGPSLMGFHLWPSSPLIHQQMLISPLLEARNCARF